MQQNDIVESVLVTLSSTGKCSRRALHQFLKSRGFKSDEDLYYLPAEGVAAWQSPAVALLSVFSNAGTVYETEEDIAEGDSEWDRLELEYPICALAREFMAKFVAECDAICSRFALKAFISDESKSVPEIATHLNSIADRTARQFFEPGSEELARMVEARYGR
ncbi:MAG: hypothetical protein ABL871_15210 [Terricaulis sp.]